MRKNGRIVPRTSLRSWPTCRKRAATMRSSAQSYGTIWRLLQIISLILNTLFLLNDRRHYGAIVEMFTKALKEEVDEEKRYEMAKLIANHMKRDLSNWNVDAMSDAKVADDLEQYTEGKVVLNPDNFQFISDGELLSSLISTTVKKKKKK